MAWDSFWTTQRIQRIQQLCAARQFTRRRDDGREKAKAPPTQNKPVGDHRACLPTFLLTPLPITLCTIEFFFGFFIPTSSLHKLGRVYSVTCRLLLLAMPVILPKADTWGRLFHLL